MIVYMAKRKCANGSIAYAQTGFSFSSNTCKGWSIGGFKLAIRNCIKKDLDRGFRGTLDNKFDFWFNELKSRSVSIDVIALDMDTLKAENTDLGVWYDKYMRGK